ncbi:MAG: hypothetical protein V1837_04895 [Candidatus Woesearchaeota archaeon]
MTEEKILETKVLDEKTVENRWRQTLLIAASAALIGAAGYGINELQTRAGYVGKSTMLRMSDYAVRNGLSEDIWSKFPESEKNSLIKKQLAAMPNEQSWELVKPTIDKKVKQEWQNTKKDARFMYNTLKQYFAGD